jgi:hypothetical protein
MRAIARGECRRLHGLDAAEDDVDAAFRAKRRSG